MSDFAIMSTNLLARQLRRVLAIPSAICRELTFLREGTFVASGSFIDPHAKIGRRTRINAVSHIGKCTIGSYCAIGGRLIVRSVNHDMRFLNLQGFAQHKFLQAQVPVTGVDKGDVQIGHGVWMGDSVIVLPGAKIGNGAVIGAGAVVTKPIPDYAIAVGNPAKVVKYRYSEEIREALAAIEWWEWDQATIQRNRWLFETDLCAIDPQQLAMLQKSQIS
jgi:acetyltransferase-like isoleucine patch superfamily enzyme